MAQEHIDFTTPGGDTVTQALHKSEDNFNDLYTKVGALSPISSFKNKLINGNFDFWQRGTFLAAATGVRYLADRWALQSGGSTLSATQAPFLGSAQDGAVPNAPKYFMRMTTASVAGAANYAQMVQKIEGSRTLAGKTVTVSFWAKSSDTPKLGVNMAQSFGGGGSANVEQSGQAIALNANWTKYALQFTLPSVVGKTIIEGADTLVMRFWTDAGSNNNTLSGTIGQQSGSVDIAQVQVEDGSVDTAFDLRPPATELALCQRYFEKSYDVGVNPGTNTTAGLSQFYINGLPSVQYTISIVSWMKVTKRATPTVTPYTTAGVSGKVRDAQNAADVTPISALINTNVIDYGVVMAAANSVINVQHHWTADAEL